MFKHFLRLQWKSFFRSSNLGKGLTLKIIMIFFAIYMIASFTALGASLFFILKEVAPDIDPMLSLSRYLIYWLFAELLFRYFMQKLPVMNVKPFLTLPVKKSNMAHFILAKSGLSFYNFLSQFLFVPFAIVLLVQGYPFLNVVVWLVSMTALAQTINFLNFIINKKDAVFIGIVILIGTLFALEYFTVLPIVEIAGQLFYTLYQYPILTLFPISIAVFLYYINYNFLRNRVYLDAAIKRKTKIAIASDLGWTKKFGSIAPFLQLDLKMIWRNKRTKTQVFISLAMIFYGLIFYTMDDFGPTSPMMVFVGIFITGIFLTNFGQFIPAWDSAYYGMIMSQNIPLRNYLESKAGLITASVVVMFLLSIPYVYFGWQALAINFSCALYNLGINIPVILFFGSFNKKRIDLDKSAFGNIQGAGAAQFLVMLPIMGFPIILFLVLKLLTSFEVALTVLAILGVFGLIFRNALLHRITEVYRTKKYAMISGFREGNS